jgi:hypothetical protein
MMRIEDDLCESDQLANNTTNQPQPTKIPTSSYSRTTLSLTLTHVFLEDKFSTHSHHT